MDLVEPEYPGLIIIGAMKAGTSHLYELLSRHPLLRPCRLKEPQFFAQGPVTEDEREAGQLSRMKGSWAMGRKWYKGLFPSGAGLGIEASTFYSRFPRHSGVADRIARNIPNVKVVYLLRNPVDRALSHYLHNVAAGNELRRICDALTPKTTSPYIYCGLYHMQLSIYRAVLSSPQIHLIISERLWADTQIVIDDLLQFAGLPSLKLDKSISSDRNDGISKFEAMLARSSGDLTDAQRDIVRALGEAPQARHKTRWVAQQLGFDDGFRRHLQDCFSYDRSCLEYEVGSPIAEWNT